MTITFQQFEQLAADVRELLFYYTVNQKEVPNDTVWPLQWFLESYNHGRYVEIMEVGNCGMASMAGKSLLTRCSEICSDSRYARAADSLKKGDYSAVVDAIIKNNWDYVIAGGDIIEAIYNKKTDKTSYFLNPEGMSFKEVFPSNHVDC